MKSMNVSVLILSTLLACYGYVATSGASEVKLTDNTKKGKIANQLITLEQQYSYGMGVNTQARFTRSKTYIDAHAFTLAMEHVFSSKDLLMTEIAIADVIEKLKGELKSGVTDKKELDQGTKQSNTSLITATNQVAFTKAATYPQQYSYAMGVKAAQKLQQQGYVIDIKAFNLGVEHGKTKQQTLLTSIEISDALSTIKQQLAERRARTNKLVSENFLKANANIDGVKVTESGLQYQIIAKGVSNIRPNISDKVTVNYRGTLIDNTEFASSYARNSAMLINVADMIPGWAEGMQLMTLGSKWKLFIPAELAYGEAVDGNTVGPNMALIIEVELLNIDKVTYIK